MKEPYVLNDFFYKQIPTRESFSSSKSYVFDHRAYFYALMKTKRKKKEHYMNCKSGDDFIHHLAHTRSNSPRACFNSLRKLERRSGLQPNCSLPTSLPSVFSMIVPTPKTHKRAVSWSFRLDRRNFKPERPQRREYVSKRPKPSIILSLGSGQL